MTTANDMHGIMTIAKDKEKHLLKQKQIADQEAYDLVKREIEEHSDLFFSKVLEDIKTAAAKGQTHYDYSYNEDTKKDKAEASVIAEAARKHGFIVHYKTERVDHGDSAAPCVVQEHWIEIRWATENYNRQ